MAGQDFTITQLRYDGNAQKYVNDPNGDKLTWNVKNRAIPKQPWEYGLELRTVREDYPGSSFEPIEQVLGPNWEPFTLEGMLDDRYGGAGFANDQRKRMEALASAGAPVRINFEQLSFDGLIKNLKLRYLNGFRCAYSFQISPHFRDEDAPRAETAASKKKRTAVASFIRSLILQAAADMQDIHNAAPVPYIVGTLYADTSVIVGDIVSRVNTISDVVDGRVLTVLPPALAGRDDQPVNSVLKVAADLEGVRSVCMTLRTSLASVSTATHLFYEETLLNMLFDGWAKSLCAQARFIAVQAREAAIGMRANAQPDAQALYEPRAGESLYDVANRFFGTPDAWRAIAQRNNLFTLELEGDELLVIPTAG